MSGPRGCLNRARTRRRHAPQRGVLPVRVADVLQVVVATMRRERDGLVTDIEGVPESMADDECATR